MNRVTNARTNVEAYEGTDEVRARLSVPGLVFTILGAAMLAVLYIYAIIAAVGNWMGMASIAQSLTGGLTAVGTVWLAVGVLLPVVVAAVALVAGRGRGPGERLLLLFLGLSLVAAAQLNIMHLVPPSSYFA